MSKRVITINRMLGSNGRLIGKTLAEELGLVHRFVNNYTNRVGCGFECAGIKTQA